MEQMIGNQVGQDNAGSLQDRHLSDAMGELILASLYEKGRLSSDDARSPRMAKSAADQFLQRVFGILAGVSLLKQSQYESGRFNISEDGVFIKPFRDEVMAQVCISDIYENEILERLHSELRNCLETSSASGECWRLLFQDEKYIVELFKGASVQPGR